MKNVERTSLFQPFYKAKATALLFLFISLPGIRAKRSKRPATKSRNLSFDRPCALLFKWSHPAVEREIKTIASAYMAVLSIGFLLVSTGGIRLSRTIQQKLSNNVFNAENETIPQEERLLRNESSINLPAWYRLKGTFRKSRINIINPFRGLLVSGTPGSGKSYFVIQHIIRQHLQKGFAIFVYEFKYPDLTLHAYHHFLLQKNNQAVNPSFYPIHFDDLTRFHRCNPLAPESLLDITDAAESSRTIMLGLNREWIRKGGDSLWSRPSTLSRL